MNTAKRLRACHSARRLKRLYRYGFRPNHASNRFSLAEGPISGRPQAPGLAGAGVVERSLPLNSSSHAALLSTFEVLRWLDGLNRPAFLKSDYDINSDPSLVYLKRFRDEAEAPAVVVGINDDGTYYVDDEPWP